MADSKLANPTAEAISPLPECAICLETCTNNCHSDSCMHQFCYRCLLAWSEIKEECPICKKAFKSIIHDNKYDDEYFVENMTVEDSRYFENALVYLPRIAIIETAGSDHDSDVMVVSDANQPSSPIINVVDTDSDESFPLSQMVSKLGPRSQKHVTSSSGSSSSTSQSGSTELDIDCNQEDLSSDPIVNVVDTDSDESLPRSQMVPNEVKPRSQMVSKTGPRLQMVSKFGSRSQRVSKFGPRSQKHVTSSSSSSASTSQSESTELDIDCNQEDQSSDPIVNVVDTDSDGSFPRSQMVPNEIEPKSQMVSKTGPRIQMVSKFGSRSQKYVTSSSGSSSSTSQSESTESDGNCNGMYQQRKRFKKYIKDEKKAKRKKTY